MEYQKIANFLDNEGSNQPSKIRTKNCVEINYESKEPYGTGSDINFETAMLRPNLCDYTDVYILVKGTIKITGARDDDTIKRLDERNKSVIFKNCAPFTECVNRINGTEIDTAQDIDIAMPLHDLIEYSDNYSKTSASLWQYYKDEPNDNLIDSESFKYKIKITQKAPADGNTKDVEIIAPLKYLRNFWRTLEMPLINCEVNFILTWPSTCVITNAAVS